MSLETPETNLTQSTGALRQRWSKLTDADFDRIGGSREKLLGRLQEIYSLSAERAEAELRDWERHQEPIVFA
jgi:uncharacterized protein YjbJ (UPF0337 family)